METTFTGPSESESADSESPLGEGPCHLQLGVRLTSLFLGWLVGGSESEAPPPHRGGLGVPGFTQGNNSRDFPIDRPGHGRDRENIREFAPIPIRPGPGFRGLPRSSVGNLAGIGPGVSGLEPENPGSRLPAGSRRGRRPGGESLSTPMPPLAVALGAWGVLASSTHGWY